MTGTHPDGPAIYGVPLGLWITVLVAVLSSTAAVFVAWRSNANSRKNLGEQLRLNSEQFTAKIEHDAAQLLKQLSHDADQKDRERQMSLRREVYLEAASALFRLQTLLGKVADIEHEQKIILAEFADMQAKLAKVHIVGSQTTVEAVMSYVNAFGPAFFALLAHRASLTIRKSKVDTHVGLANKASLERDRCIEMMRQMNLEGSRDPARWSAVEYQDKFAREQQEMHNKKAAEYRSKQLNEILAVGALSLNYNIQLLKLLPHAVLSVRGELELPLDEERYKQLWNQQIEGESRSFKTGMDQLKQITSAAEAEDGPSTAPGA